MRRVPGATMICRWIHVWQPHIGVECGIEGAMTGHNHYASCTCGWCLNLGGRRRSGVLYSSGGSPAAFRTYESFTNPNATCPVCGAAVFFYQSPSGGRVFFDELGPPWPKHPCTDAAPPALGSRMPPARTDDPPAWLRSDWTPVILQNSRMVGQWHVIPVELIARRLHIEVLCASAMRVPVNCAAHMHPFDATGRGELSIVDLDAPIRAARVIVFEKKRYSLLSPFAAIRSDRSSPGT